MTPHTCQFEEQVLAAVASGDWPDRADQALRAHVTECSTCADLAMATQARSRKRSLAAPWRSSRSRLPIRTC